MRQRAKYDARTTEHISYLMLWEQLYAEPRDELRVGRKLNN